MSRILKIISWFDENLLTVLAGFLLVFIPLYPKIPLFDAIPGYLVRVRPEDFLILFTLGIYFLQLIRRKISFQLNPAAIGIILYLIFGLLSSLSAVFIAQTVPMEPLHVQKTFLHFFRRIEYFSLFFILFSALKSAKVIKIFTVILFVTLAVVTVYGYGQKYLYWPAWSTMNREFAKGWVLYLTEHARVLSTFGGHYDLAGYLVILLTLCWSFFFGLKQKLLKLGVGVILAGGFWLLILTASRISFIGYLIGLTAVVFVWMFKKGFGWGVTRWAMAIFLSLFIMLTFGDLSDRFLRLIKVSDRLAGIREVLLRPTGAPPTDKAVFLENNLAAVTSKSDQPPTLLRPADVTGKEPELLVVTYSATGEKILTPKQRTYSKNAFLYDLSTAIRLDETWPRAIKNFTENPLLGSGYATLQKINKYQFTEAESTDSDYLRALGETGILGFSSFFGTIAVMMFLCFRKLSSIKEPWLYGLVGGFIGASIGLLANASYIDIFVSSKVAEMYWAVGGLTLGSLYFYREKLARDYEPLKLEIPWRKYLENVKHFFLSDKFWVGIICVGAFLLRMYKFDAPLADWHSWRQADTSAVTRNFLRYHQINWLYPTYDDLSSVASGKPNPKGLRMVEYPLYNIASYFVKNTAIELTVEGAGRVTTVLFSLASLTFIFLICKKLLSRRAAYFSAIMFGILPYSIFYGRVILPDPTMVALSLGALWFGINNRVFLSVIFAAAALLVKPYAIFLLAPLIFLNIKYIFFLGIAAIPLGSWRWWMGQFPEGIPASSWLLNGDGIRFKGAFWYWIFADRIGRLILGYWGLIPLAFGWLKAPRFIKIFLLSSLIYLIIFATGNVRHDYYQILLLPAISILLGLGFDYLLNLNKLLAIVSLVFMLGFGWYHVRGFYNINHPEIVEAGQKVKDLTDWRSLVVAPYDGDTAFLYQTDRQGWPIMEGSTDDMIKKGADYYVSVRFDDLTKKLMADAWPVWDKITVPKRFYPYKLLAYTDKYVVIQLVPDDKLPH